MDATDLFMHAVVLMLVLMNTFIVKSETLQTDMYEVAYDMSESISQVHRNKHDEYRSGNALLWSLALNSK